MLLFTPAVSRSRNRPDEAPSCESSTSILCATASVVVPATSETTARSIPNRRLRSVLLPTFGLPMTATVGRVVELVHGKHDLFVPLLGSAAKLTGDGGVGLGHPEPGVGEVEYDVRLLNRDTSLQGDERLETSAGARFHPTGVHQQKLLTRPLGPVI